MLKSPIEIVHDVQQRKYDPALSALDSSGAVAFNTPAVVIEISQRAQIHIVFVAQLLLKPLNFGRLSFFVFFVLVFRGLHDRIKAARGRSCRPYLVCLNSASITSSAPPAGAPLGPPGCAPDEEVWAWLA